MYQKKKIENPNMKPIPRIWNDHPFVMLVCWPVTVGVVIIPTMFAVGYFALGVCYLLEFIRFLSSSLIQNIWAILN